MATDAKTPIEMPAKKSEGILQTLVQTVKDNPSIATIPLGALLGGGISKYLQDPEDDKSALKTAIGAIVGAGAGGLLGSAMTKDPGKDPFPKTDDDSLSGALGRDVNKVGELAGSGIATAGQGTLGAYSQFMANSGPVGKVVGVGIPVGLAAYIASKMLRK